MVGALAIVMLLAGAVLSWCGWRSANVGGLHENAARPRRFLAIVALMASALFLFGLLLQMAVPLFLPGCVG
jgi:formate hydrogenlyase subunit 3/multisubunit Na+/H+ antiporter MnhD subunit